MKKFIFSYFFAHADGEEHTSTDDTAHMNRYSTTEHGNDGTEEHESPEGEDDDHGGEEEHHPGHYIIWPSAFGMMIFILVAGYVFYYYYSRYDVVFGKAVVWFSICSQYNL